MTDAKPPLHQADATTPGDAFRTTIKVPGHELIADVPQAHGGSDEAPSPMVLLAAALAACTTMTVRSYAHRKGWPLTSVRAQVEHHRPEGELPERYLVQLTLEGDLDAEQRSMLETISHKCPVHKALSGQMSVNVSMN